MNEDQKAVTRRDLFLKGGAALAALRLFETDLLAQVWPQNGGETLLPFLDATPEPPQPALGDLNSFAWRDLNDWITPTADFFKVAHYDQPEIDAGSYRLEVAGRVRTPLSLGLDELQKQPRQEVTYTLECAGNNGFPWFVAGIGNARWAGTPLAPILERAGILDDGVEIVFFGHDAGEEEFARQTVPQNFARSLSVDDALDDNLLLCWEMNGEPLPKAHGFPLRLIAPGWFGIANVKWLDRIEVWTTRYAGRFMARDYVTVREEPQPEGASRYTQKVVGRSLIKSVPARVTEKDGRHRLYGMAWGAPIDRVEVQVDDGPWRRASFAEGASSEFAWKFWSAELPGLTPGEHSVTSRAIDTDGRVQPTADDPVVAKKLTYWEDNGQIKRRFRIG